MKKSLVFTLCLVLIVAGCGSEDPAPKSIDPSVEASRDAAAAERVDAIIEEHTVKKRPTYTEEEIEAALGGLTKYTDEFKPGYATYKYPIEIPAYKKNRKVYATVNIELYINTDPENHALLCACTEYKGKSWVFFDDMLFLGDDEIYTIHVKRRDKTEKVTSGALEKYSWALTDEDVAMFEQLIACTKRKLKLQGKDSFFIYEFSEEAVTSISEVLDAYKKLTSS